MSVREEIINHALLQQLELLQKFHSKATTENQRLYFEMAIKECKAMMTEVRFNGSINL